MRSPTAAKIKHQHRIRKLPKIKQKKAAVTAKAVMKAKSPTAARENLPIYLFRIAAENNINVEFGKWKVELFKIC